MEPHLSENWLKKLTKGRTGDVHQPDLDNKENYSTLLITFGVKKVLPAMKKLAAVKYVN
jgi:hypothetical protein